MPGWGVGTPGRSALPSLSSVPQAGVCGRPCGHARPALTLLGFLGHDDDTAPLPTALSEAQTQKHPTDWQTQLGLFSPTRHSDASSSETGSQPSRRNFQVRSA